MKANCVVLCYVMLCYVVLCCGAIQNVRHKFDM